ncbi:MAG: hypothetical protein A2Y17_06650 [Clostridiales bacterium GWF2_38_85]|nr:MAG: hypothetical protein A2Y17_06650 [Clostridiales bacterium GWF2_38_85]HBL84894.1 hypothetical protein [Clostridiales bacterium]
MKKRVFVVAICLIMIIIPSFSVFALNTNYEDISVCRDSIDLYVNGKKLDVDVFEHFGTTYVPMRAVAEAVGWKVTYDGVLQRGYITWSNTGSTSTTTKADLMLASLYKDAQLLLVSMYAPTSGASNTAMIQAYMGDYEAAYAYFKDVSDTSLNACIKTIESIISKFNDVLKKYNLQNTTVYKTKYTDLQTMLTEVKTKTKDFSQATLYFLEQCAASSNTNDTTSYRDYNTKLSALIDLINNYSTTFQTRFEEIMSNVVGSDYSIITDDN